MRQKLPLVKGKSKNTSIPNKEALLSCCSVASTIDAANYMVERFEKIFEKELKNTKSTDSKANVFLRVLQTLKDYAENVFLQRGSRSDPWKGQPDNVKGDFQNLQKNLAESSLKILSEFATGNLRVDIAVSKNSELLRAFSMDGKPLDAKIAAAMDKLLNSTLAANNMISKNGVIYEANSDGQIQKDAAGNPMKANEEKIKKVLSEDLQKNLADNGINTNIQQHAFPEKKPQAPVKPEVVAPAKPSVEKVQRPEVQPSEEVTPTTGVGGGMGGKS